MIDPAVVVFTVEVQGFKQLAELHAELALVLPEFVHVRESTPAVIVNHESRTLRAVDAEGDRWFGLTSGTNGTGPAQRRMNYPDGYAWHDSRGKPSVGVTLVPSNTSPFRNPWGGR